MNVMLANLATPSETEMPRMAPLARLPVFFALEGRRAVVAGGTAAAAWKAELLSATGAQVEVYAPEPGEEMLALAAQPPRGTIGVQRRPCEPGDIRGAAIAIGACDSDDEAARLPRRPAPWAFPSTSSTGRTSATLPSAPSSTARRW
jgi:uroporphyrin-III C-methyltransferase/precorrin-2 dehydrogenase/sirohydrochlorin ferrochelatase